MPNYAMMDADDALQYDAAFVESVVRACPAASNFIKPFMLRWQKTLALLAVAHDGMLLRDVGATLQNDYEVAAAAVLQNEDAIVHAGPGVVERVAMPIERRRRRKLLFQTTAWASAAYACLAFAYATLHR